MDILTLINTVLTVVLTSVCGYGTWYFQKKFSVKSGTAEAIKIILRKELREMYQDCLAKGYATYDEYEEFTTVYEIYHDKLNGNGTGTKLYNEFSKLPVKEE